ncbi:unnamed protein product [Owenia fusiformis]|uniref:Peptidase S1 domain-containing protein n=1 Tax=Owenia fusiformis TaxID=6347 RepID=A0A8S4N9W2_OWEFU|nr:unnamed protein product [Owenia fusiformis]
MFGVKYAVSITLMCNIFVIDNMLHAARTKRGIDIAIVDKYNQLVKYKCRIKMEINFFNERQLLLSLIEMEGILSYLKSDASMATKMSTFTEVQSSIKGIKKSMKQIIIRKNAYDKQVNQINEIALGPSRVTPSIESLIIELKGFSFGYKLYNTDQKLMKIKLLSKLVSTVGKKKIMKKLAKGGRSRGSVNKFIVKLNKMKKVLNQLKKAVLKLKYDIVEFNGISGIGPTAGIMEHVPVAPEHGEVQEIVSDDMECGGGYTVSCQYGYQLNRDAKYDILRQTTEENLVTDEIQCIATPIGHWPLTIYDKSNNTAQFNTKKDGSSTSISVNNAELLNVDFDNRDGILKFDGDFTWLMYIYIDGANTPNVKLLHYYGFTLFLSDISKSLEKRSWYFITLIYVKSLSSLAVYINGKFDVEFDNIELFKSKDIADSVVIQGAEESGRLRLTCVSVYAAALGIDDIQTAKERCRLDDIVASWPLDKLYGSSDVSRNAYHIVRDRVQYGTGIDGSENGSVKTGKLPSNGYLSNLKIPTMLVRHQLSWLGYIYIESLSCDSPLVDFSTNGIPGFYIWILQNGGLKTRIGFYDVTGEKDTITTDRKLFEFKTWYHVAFTFDGSVGVQYIDGVRVAEKNISLNGDILNGPGYIGKSANSQMYFDGRLACVQIYRVALTDDQINDKMNCLACSRQPISPKTVSAQVSGGVPAYPNSWPWMVQFILKRVRLIANGYVCGGILYKPNVVISAAHCFVDKRKEDLRVIIGAHWRFGIRDEEGVQMIGVREMFVHPDFDGDSFDNDIAVILLDKNAILSDSVQPCCIEEDLMPEGTDCFVTGWGTTQNANERTDKLRQAHIPILEEKKCREPRRYERPLTRNMFCAGTWNGTVDSCGGDSGGPLVCRYSTKSLFKLVGIVSWGPVGKCGQASQPGVYTQVRNYIDWIHAKISLKKETVTTSAPSRPKTTLSQGCGIPGIGVMGKTIGGNETIPHRWPWVVAILFDGNIHCGGTLYSRDIVITAASCVVGRFGEISLLTVLVGTHTPILGDELVQRRDVETVVTHPQFREDRRMPFAKFNDVAVIKLSDPVSYDEHARPICPPISSPVDDKLCISTGWGFMHQSLHQVELSILGISDCRKIYKRKVTNDMLCTHDSTGKDQNVCLGDGGVPLFCASPDDPNVYHLAGISSWGPNRISECKIKPSVFMDVYSYLDWINDVIDSL